MRGDGGRCRRSDDSAAILCLPSPAMAAPAAGGGRAKRKLCVVCDNAPRDVLLTACGHFTLCDGCAAQLLARGGPCPTCRMPVRAVGGTRCVGPAAALERESSYDGEAVDPETRARALADAPEDDEDEEEAGAGEDGEEEESESEPWTERTLEELCGDEMSGGDVAEYLSNNEVPIETLVAVMHARADEADVQKAACANLLQNWCTDNHKAEAGGAGAIEAVIAALCAHSDNAGVQRRACRALGKLCFDADSRAKAGGAGAIEAVVAALRARDATAAVLRDGCGALGDICYKHTENKEKAGGTSAVETVVAAMCAHIADAAVQKTAAAPLESCASMPKPQQKRAGQALLRPFLVRCVRTLPLWPCSNSAAALLETCPYTVPATW